MNRFLNHLQDVLLCTISWGGVLAGISALRPLLELCALTLSMLASWALWRRSVIQRRMAEREFCNQCRSGREDPRECPYREGHRPEECPLN